MSLDFSLKNVKDWEDLYGPGPHGEMNIVTHCLIWNMMSIDMGKITEENVEEVFTRLKMVEKVSGPPMWKGTGKDREPRGFTLDDVRRHIGMTTNVHTTTKTQFAARIAKQLRDHATAEYRTAKAEEDKPQLTVVG